MSFPSITTPFFFFQVRWVFSYAARFAQFRRSVHSLTQQLSLPAILCKWRSVKHMTRLSTVRLRSVLSLFLLLRSFEGASGLLSHTHSSVGLSHSEFTTDKAAAIKHCVALGLYVETFWKQDIYNSECHHPSQEPHSTSCTTAHLEHLRSAQLNGELHRKAYDFLTHYSRLHALRKES